MAPNKPGTPSTIQTLLVTSPSERTAGVAVAVVLPAPRLGAGIAGVVSVDPRFAKRLIWNLLPALLVVSAIGTVLAGDDGLLERHVLKQRLVSMQDQVANIQAENVGLKMRVLSLRQDPLAVRRAAATGVYAAQPGSTIYRFVSP
jgi:cell division protein FtsB